MLGLEHKIELFGDGELAYCTVCGGAEGSLLSFCPGYKLNAEAEQACYQGNVVDLKLHVEMKVAREKVERGDW
jgi:hypothetical protein